MLKFQFIIALFALFPGNIYANCFGPGGVYKSSDNNFYMLLKNDNFRKANDYNLFALKSRGSGEGYYWDVNPYEYNYKNFLVRYFCNDENNTLMSWRGDRYGELWGLNSIINLGNFNKLRLQSREARGSVTLPPVLGQIKFETEIVKDFSPKLPSTVVKQKMIVLQKTRWGWAAGLLPKDFKYESPTSCPVLFVVTSTVKSIRPLSVKMLSLFNELDEQKSYLCQAPLSYEHVENHILDQFDAYLARNIGECMPTTACSDSERKALDGVLWDGR